MAETGQYIFNYKEVVEALLKKQGIHDGIWQLFVKFNLGAANVGPTETEVTPAALVTITQLGLLKTDKESSISVDAARVNPTPPTKRKRETKTKP